MLPFFKTHGVSLDVFMFLSFLSLDADVTNPSAISHTPRSPNLSTVLNLALSAGSWRWMSCMTGARFGKITAIPTGWIYNILYICTHTHVLHPIAAAATATTTTTIITTVVMWLCSAGSDGYTLIAEKASHSATNFRVTSFVWKLPWSCGIKIYQTRPNLSHSPERIYIYTKHHAR